MKKLSSMILLAIAVIFIFPVANAQEPTNEKAEFRALIKALAYRGDQIPGVIIKVRVTDQFTEPNSLDLKKIMAMPYILESSWWIIKIEGTETTKTVLIVYINGEFGTNRPCPSDAFDQAKELIAKSD